MAAAAAGGSARGVVGESAAWAGVSSGADGDATGCLPQPTQPASTHATSRTSEHESNAKPRSVSASVVTLVKQSSLSTDHPLKQPANRPTLFPQCKQYLIGICIFGRPHVLSAARVRENWFLGLTKHGAILTEGCRNVNREFLPFSWAVLALGDGVLAGGVHSPGADWPRAGAVGSWPKPERAVRRRTPAFRPGSVGMRLSP